MSTDKLKIILIASSVILLLLIFFLLSIIRKKESTKKLFPIKFFLKEEKERSKIETKPSGEKGKISPTPTPTKTLLESIKIADKQTSAATLLLVDKLPLKGENYAAVFSPTFTKIFLVTKNQQGEEEFKNALRNLELSRTRVKDFVVKIKSAEEIDKYREQEKVVRNRHIEETKEIKPTPTPYRFKNYEEYQKDQALRSNKSLENALRKFIRTLSIPAESFGFQTQINPSPPPLAKKTPPPTLKGIALEVSQRVGIPEGIIMGVLSIENPAVFYLPEIKVREYSKADAVWPECKPNVCSATGPMQITIGIDSNGSSSCSQCCWKGKCLNNCPNQWALYAHSVNIFGKYNREPNPCNILDNIYAGALKLKTDAQAKNPFKWSREEVFRAALAYYGDCTVKYERLGNRTYCEYLWDYYVSYGQ